MRSAIHQQAKRSPPGEPARAAPIRPATAPEAQRPAPTHDISGVPIVLQRKTTPGPAVHPYGTPNRTGLPDRLKAGIESLSAMSMDNVRVHYNSPEPARLQAHAYARGTDIHLAPGQERHLPHEAWHVVQQHGSVSPTMQMAGGVPVNDDPALERDADIMGKRAAGLIQAVPQSAGGLGNPQPAGSADNVAGAAAATGNQRNLVAQRTVSDANRYVTSQNLWREGKNLYELMAALYQECSPEFDNIYQHLIYNLPLIPVEPTDGYDPPTVDEIDETLEEEIAKQRRQSLGDPMPPKVSERVTGWSAQVSNKKLDRRDDKKSDANRKRAKMMNAGGNEFLLYHTKTAPTKNQQGPRDQGKSAYFNKNQADYFRSSAENVQRDILGIEAGNKRGDPHFVNALDATYSIKDGSEKKPLLSDEMMEEDPTPFGKIKYNSNLAGQNHPGPKLGTEINSFTYNKLGYSSKTSTYRPNTGLGEPKQYLESQKDQYFDEAWYLTDRHHDVPQDYETELLQHYRNVVSGAKQIYPTGIGSIEGRELRLISADMKGQSEFSNYPGLVFELLDKTNLKTNVAAIKNNILAKWNTISAIKMTERQSFGFLYPSISDLEKSIRIWPGQYQVEQFLDVLGQVIEPKSSGKNAKTADKAKLPLLQNTLKRSMNLATAAVDRVEAPNDKVKLLFNRIASNYGKGLEILRQWNDLGVDVLFVETTQIIENLNEAALHLATEYDQRLARSSFSSAVLNHYLKHVGQAGYGIDSFYLTHSGQQASSSTKIFSGADATFLKTTIKDRGPIYFETMTSKSNAQQIKLVDPAYNFTTEEEVGDFAKHAVGDAQIYDITNFDPAELSKILGENTHPTVSLYASFSKHFQFGTDSTNLGFVMHVSKDKGRSGKDRKVLEDYVPNGAVWDSSSKLEKKPKHVPAVPSELYHHAALLFEAQTGSGSGKHQQDVGSSSGKEEQYIGGPQQFFMGHQFSDWHGNHRLEVAEWVGADDQCGIHSLHYLLGTPDSRQQLLNSLPPQLSFATEMTLWSPNEWLDQNALIEIAALKGARLAVYEFNQEYGRWSLVAGDADNPDIFIGRVPHARGGGNDHWVPLRRL